MIRLLLLFLLAPTLPLFSQSIRETKVDKFNGIKTVTTTTESLVQSMGVPQVSVFGSVVSKDGQIQRALFFTYLPGRVSSLKEGESEVILLLEGGDPVSLKYSGNYKILTSRDRAIFYSIVTTDQLKLLEKAKVTDVRTPSYDYKVKERQQEVVSKIAALLLAQSSDGETQAVTKQETSSKSGSLADELKKLKELFDSGAITQAEYDAAKKKLLEQ